MTDHDRASSTQSTTSRIRWLALPAVVAALGGIWFWWQRSHKPEVLISADIPVLDHNPPIPVLVSIKPPALPKKTQSPLRWLLYIASTLLFAGLLIVLQGEIPSFSTILFVLLLIVAALYGIWRLLRWIWRLVQSMRMLIEAHYGQQLARHADGISFLAVGFSIFCAIWSAQILRGKGGYTPELNQVFYLFAIGSAALGIALLLKPHLRLASDWHIPLVTSNTSPEARYMPVHTSRVLAAVAGVVLLFLLAEINGQLLHLVWLQHVRYLLQLAFLVIGIILLVAGVGGRIHLPAVTRREALLLTAIVVVAFVLRSVALETNIHRLIDEVNFMDAVPRLWTHPDTLILSPFSELTAFTWLYPIFQNGFTSLVGSSLTALRLPSAVFGTLGVAALYFLARTLFHDKAIACISALILATFPAHIHFSRLALNNIADPFFGTLALAFLMRGFQSQRRSDFVIAGAILGLTQYFYEGGRLLFPPLLLLSFVIAWIYTGRKRADLIHGAYALLVAVLVAAPVYYTLLGTHNLLTPRLASASVENSVWKDLLENNIPDRLRSLSERVLNPFLMYTTIRDQGWFYGGTESLVIFMLLPVFVLGLVHELWNIRTPAILVLIAWLGAASLGNVLLTDSLWIPRYVVAFPAVALLIAIGAKSTLPLLLPRSISAKWLYAVIGGLSLILAIGQTVYYFYDHVPAYTRQFQPDEDWNDAFFRMVDLPTTTQVHFIMDEPVWSFNVIAFMRYYRLNMNFNALLPGDVTPELIQKMSAFQTVTHVFFISPNRTDVLARLKQCFKLSEPEFSPYDIPLESQLGLYRGVVIPSQNCIYSPHS